MLPHTCTFSSYREELKKRWKKILCIQGPFYSRIHKATGGIIDTFGTSLNGDLFAHSSPTTSPLTSFHFHFATKCLWIAMKSISDKMLWSVRNYFEYRQFGLKWYGEKKNVNSSTALCLPHFNNKYTVLTPKRDFHLLWPNICQSIGLLSLIEQLLMSKCSSFFGRKQTDH